MFIKKLEIIALCMIILKCRYTMLGVYFARQNFFCIFLYPYEF
jgi:hypothetical protein